MTRYYTSVAGTIVSAKGPTSARRGLAAVLATFVAAVALTGMLSTTFTTAPSPRVPSGDLTDGFLPGAIAANAAQAGSAIAITDGWTAGLMGSAGSHDLRGGWEARITPSAAAATEIRDGWETRLAD